MFSRKSPDYAFIAIGGKDRSQTAPKDRESACTVQPNIPDFEEAACEMAHTFGNLRRYA
jgi:hypothetical protein